MLRPSVMFVLTVVAFAVPRAEAQQRTTVQLPTFNQTTVGTTVSVPDGGTALLGGINRAAEGSTARGVPLLSKLLGANRLFQNRGIGRETGAMSMTVTPRVIDLREEELRQTGFSWDDPLRAAGGGFREERSDGGQADPAVARQAAFLARNLARHDVPAAQHRPLPENRTESLATIRQQHQRQSAARADEAERCYAEGWRAESSGQLGVARIYYQMALRRSEGQQREAIRARLAHLDGAVPPVDQLADR